MTITGVDISALATSVVPIKSGNSSNDTNSLQSGDSVGTIWVSPVGDVFVQEQSGPVALSRVGYGWETRRFFMEPDSSFPGHIEPGVNIWFQSGDPGPNEDYFRDAGGTHSSGSPVAAPAEGGSYAQDGWMFGVSVQDTAASNYTRLCVRGLEVYTDRTHTDGDTWSKLRDYQNGFRLSRPHDSFPVEHQLKNYWHTDLLAERWFGWTPHPSSIASKVSDAGGDHTWRHHHLMWVFGSESRTNEPN